MMFNPNEWKRSVQYTLDKPRTVYINNHTGLPKLKQTFSREQQEALEDMQMVRVYIIGISETKRSENDMYPPSG